MAEGLSWLWDKLWPAKLMYIVFNISQSAAVNFVNVYYQDVAMLPKFQIAVLQTLACSCSLFAPTLWGAVADATKSTRKVHVFCLFTGAFFMYLISYISSFSLMCVMVFAANFQTSPNNSLLDENVMRLIDTYGGQYGKQRMFGAVGYGIGAYFTGIIVSAWGIQSAFNIHLLTACGAIGVLFLFPETEMVKTEDHDEVVEEASFSRTLSLVWEKKDLVVLFFVVFLAGLMFGVISTFLTLFLYNLSGMDTHIIGVAIFTETFSELPAFFYSHQIINKLGIVKVLCVSICGYALRLSVYAFTQSAWACIPVELLHGVTFGLSWAACTQYVYAAAPKGTAGTVMGMLNSIQNGLGRGAGTLIGGFLYQTYGARTMWQITLLGVPLALFGVYLFSQLMDTTAKELAESEVELAGMLSPQSPLLPKGKAEFVYTPVNGSDKA